MQYKTVFIHWVNSQINHWETYILNTFSLRQTQVSWQHLRTSSSPCGIWDWLGFDRGILLDVFLLLPPIYNGQADVYDGVSIDFLARLSLQHIFLVQQHFTMEMPFPEPWLSPF